MPITKFSWRAMREHIRKYLWIYLLGIALCLAGTDLLWTTTAPRVPREQDVIVYLADGYSNAEPMSEIAQDMLTRTQPFDETLQKVEFYSMMYSENDYTSAMVLMTRLTVGEVDVFLANQAVMDSLSTSGALQPLDDAVAAGWLAEYNLEPCYVTVTAEDSGENADDNSAGDATYLGALKLDTVKALETLGVMACEDHYLCITNNGGNVETAMKAVEYMIEDLMENDYAATDDTQPAA